MRINTAKISDTRLQRAAVHPHRRINATIYWEDQFRRAAEYVDRILKGKKSPCRTCRRGGRMRERKLISLFGGVAAAW
jgi:hypothetical protein